MIPQQVAVIVKEVVEVVPVATQAYGFTRTAISVYNSKTPLGAVKEAVKGIIGNCTPPFMKKTIRCILFFEQLRVTVYYKGAL